MAIDRASRLRFHVEGIHQETEYGIVLHCSTKNDFSHQEMDRLPLWSMQHAIMTSNNPSGVEIMTVENVNHIQVSSSPNFV